MVKLRRAEAADAAGVADVWLRARRASIPMIPPCVHADGDVREWISSIVIPRKDTWVAVAEEGRVVAMMVLDDGWMEQLYVDPDWVGRGVGSSLVTLAKRLHPAGLQLFTFEANRSARAFYERHGFIAVAHTDGRGNEERAPDVRCRWSGS